MTSTARFDRIQKRWVYTTGTYQVIFGGIFELYIDKSRAPDICANFEWEICTYLQECWPEKYNFEIGAMPGLLIFSDYPASQQLELLRASQAMLTDLIADRVDRRLQMHPEARPYFIKVLDEFIALMREELAAA